MPEVKTFKCHQEITEPDRAGFIQYTNMGYTNGTCSIVFRGEQRDMVIINMDTLILRSEREREMKLIKYFLDGLSVD